jgi:hypothetical protein
MIKLSLNHTTFDCSRPLIKLCRSDIDIVQKSRSITSSTTQTLQSPVHIRIRLEGLGRMSIFAREHSHQRIADLKFFEHSSKAMPLLARVRCR